MPLVSLQHFQNNLRTYQWMFVTSKSILNVCVDNLHHQVCITLILDISKCISQLKYAQPHILIHMYTDIDTSFWFESTKTLILLYSFILYLVYFLCYLTFREDANILSCIPASNIFIDAGTVSFYLIPEHCNSYF